MTVEEYMKSIDPAYGSQQHQRDRLAVMRRVDELNPCRIDHSSTNPPCHTSRCYPTDSTGRVRGA